MDSTVEKNEFDVIVVGAGACGASLARDLSKQGLSVLLIERGGDAAPRETIGGFAAVARTLSVGPGLQATTAQGVGGSTGIYFGICKLPTPETFSMLGMDLSKELEAVRAEVPVVEVNDDFLPPQTKWIRDAAARVGFPMKPHHMALDLSQCADGRYAYEAKWKALGWIDEAVAAGTTLLVRTQVKRILVEDGRAVGVEYKRGLFGGTKRATARKVVVCAGSPATPGLLIGAGVKNVGSRGFFCKPAFMMFGTVKDVVGRDAYVGLLECDLGNGITIGDGAMVEPLFKLFMLSNGKPSRMFAHRTTVAVAVALNDTLGGQVLPDGRYRKELGADDAAKLKEAEQHAAKILEAAGATDVFRSKNVAGTPGGVLWVGEHLDEHLQTTGIADLHVCDQSVIPDVRITPLITLLCLAKRLATHLGDTLGPASPASAARAEQGDVATAH